MNEQKELQYRKMLREARTQAYLPAILSAVFPLVCALLLGVAAVFLNGLYTVTALADSQREKARADVMKERAEINVQIELVQPTIKSSEFRISELQKDLAQAEEKLQKAEKKYKDAIDNYQKVAKEESQQKKVDVSKVDQYSEKARAAHAESNLAKEEFDSARKKDETKSLKSKLDTENDVLLKSKLEYGGLQRRLKELKDVKAWNGTTLLRWTFGLLTLCSGIASLVLMILSVKRLASADKRLLEIVDRQEAALNAAVKSVDAPPVQ